MELLVARPFFFHVLILPERRGENRRVVVLNLFARGVGISFLAEAKKAGLSR